MYKYISRDDCYYTDTDSVVLGSPLPEEDISSTELGKFKLETMVSKGIFLAPKSYNLETPDDYITKQKGATKDLVTPEWFDSQYADPSRKILRTVESNFRIDWEKLNIFKKEELIHLGVSTTKREFIFDDKDDKNNWVGTAPIVVKDISDHNKTRLLEYKIKCLREHLADKDRVIANLKLQLHRDC